MGCSTSSAEIQQNEITQTLPKEDENIESKLISDYKTVIQLKIEIFSQSKQIKGLNLLEPNLMRQIEFLSDDDVFDSNSTDIYVDNFKLPLFQKTYIFSENGMKNIFICSNDNLNNNLSNLFNRCYYINSINFLKINTENVVNMNNMFCGCFCLENVDISNWNTISVSDMSEMFDSCYSLKSINTNYIKTNNCKYVNGMFSKCLSLNEIDISGWSFNNIMKVDGMFEGCENLKKIKVNKSNVDFIKFKSNVSPDTELIQNY
jgi:surface protein